MAEGVRMLYRLRNGRRFDAGFDIDDIEVRLMLGVFLCVLFCRVLSRGRYTTHAEGDLTAESRRLKRGGH